MRVQRQIDQGVEAATPGGANERMQLQLHALALENELQRRMLADQEAAMQRMYAQMDAREGEMPVGAVAAQGKMPAQMPDEMQQRED